MTIHFFLFTIHVTKKTQQRLQPLPGYHPTVKDEWLDRKSSAFNRYV
ncbi:hypothetical protein JF544_03060 [Halobacillus kuroshimensis]|uniref:Uncharacterized protein n=1 Tax=Halobacillus kuroshimensis TaxID=302481 RepID=A0ABS3DS99_9BACI|nr:MULTISPECIES: hypothetical protein [Halobacillus]MBN8234206.1 hypothetical protein [Halobacillus kuroshimensis]